MYCSFYIVLSGVVSIYIDAAMTGENDHFNKSSVHMASSDTASEPPKIQRGHKLDRRSLGKYITSQGRVEQFLSTKK